VIKTTKILILAPQAIRQPGADAGTSGNLGAGLEKGDSRVMVDRFGMHRLDKAEFIHNLGCVGH